MKYLARFYPDGNYNHAIDFEYRPDGMGHNIAHIGGQRELDTKLVEKIKPELSNAIKNFHNKMQNVAALPCKVEIYSATP